MTSRVVTYVLLVVIGVELAAYAWFFGVVAQLAEIAPYVRVN